MLAIHETRTSTQSDIEEYDYTYIICLCLQVGWMMNILARGLSLKRTYKQFIFVHLSIIENKTLDPITASSTL